VNGLGVLAGLHRISVPGATGFLDTNFLGKAEYGLRALEEREFLLLHVEARTRAAISETRRRRSRRSRTSTRR